MTITKTKTKQSTGSVGETAMSKGQVAVFEPPRLPFHPAIEERFEVDKGGWKVLVEAIFPSAKSVDSVIMALAYCKQRNLDIFKRPVHIVPMWSSQLGKMVETVWPSISELRTTAFRTGTYAGKTATTFGPSITAKFEGVIEGRDNKPARQISAEVTFPEWGQCTFTRMLNGVKCEFVSPKVYWLEAYGHQGKTDVPNEMWQKRPSGQLEKCVEAAGLRVAFPEEIGNEYAAEEMEGQHLLDAAERARDVTPKRESPPPPPPPPEPQPKSPEPPPPPAAAKSEATNVEIQNNPEDILKWVKARLDKVTDGLELQDVWNDECMPRLEGIFPPDMEVAQGYLRDAEKRLEP